MTKADIQRTPWRKAPSPHTLTRFSACLTVGFYCITNSFVKQENLPLLTPFHSGSPDTETHWIRWSSVFHLPPENDAFCPPRLA